MLKNPASLSCSFGLFGLSGLFGCMRLTRCTRQTRLVSDSRILINLEMVVEVAYCYATALGAAEWRRLAWHEGRHPMGEPARGECARYIRESDPC
jgi:hypothetical protein